MMEQQLFPDAQWPPDVQAAFLAAKEAKRRCWVLHSRMDVLREMWLRAYEHGNRDIMARVEEMLPLERRYHQCAQDDYEEAVILLRRERQQDGEVAN